MHIDFYRFTKKVLRSALAECHMNKNFNQTAGQVAHKSYPSCVVRATDIAMEGYNDSH